MQRTGAAGSGRARRFNGVLTRLLLLVTLPLLAVVAGGLASFQRTVSPNLLAHSLDDVRETASTQAVVIERWVTDQQRLVQYLARRPEATAWNLPAMLDEAQHTAESFPHFRAIVFADESGNAVVDSISGSGGYVGDRDYFVRALNGESVITDVLTSRTANDAIMVFAEPVRRADGSAQGVLFASISPESLVTVPASHTDHTSITTYLIDRSGRILSGPSAGTRVERDHLPGPEIHTPFTNHLGEMVYGSRAEIEPTGWSVVSEIPAALATDAFRRYNRLIIATVAVALLVALATAAVIATTIELPISRLTRYARQLATADHRAPNAPQALRLAPRELRELRTSFKQMARAITERQRELEEANTLLEHTQEIALLGSWEYDHTTGRFSCSRELYRIAGVVAPGSEVVSPLHLLAALPHADRTRFLRLFVRSARSGEPAIEIEHEVVRVATGEVRRAFQRCVHVRDDEGALVVSRGMVHDVTDRHTYEQSLRRSVAEKSTLIQEVQHRVRNNLAVVQGILSLQRDTLPPDSPAFTVLTDSQSRIAAMALVHRQLYQSGSQTEIDLGEYIETLVGSIERSYGRPGVSTVLELEPITLSVDRAIACGMLVNEVVVNAYKHAFQADPGVISVSMARPDTQLLRLVVEDDGQGRRPTPDGQDEDGLGRRLIRQLAVQIGGDVRFEHPGITDGTGSIGTRVVIELPLDGGGEP